jgi:predicted metal-dependent RNase
MLVLEEAMRNDELPTVPVHLDGMIWEATAIHSTYPEYLRDDVRDRIFHENENPFLAEQFNHIDGGEEERRDVADGEPCIILSTSGMMEGGPILSWIEHLGGDPDSTLTFVSFQAQGTLGRRIQNGRREVPVGDGGGRGRTDTLSLQMETETVDGFSGHADRQGLENFVRTMNPRPEKVLCVHGDEASTQDLSSALYHEFNMRTFAPKNLETFRFV